MDYSLGIHCKIIAVSSVRCKFSGLFYSVFYDNLIANLLLCFVSYTVENCYCQEKSYKQQIGEYKCKIRCKIKYNLLLRNNM